MTKLPDLAVSSVFVLPYHIDILHIEIFSRILLQFVDIVVPVLVSSEGSPLFFLVANPEPGPDPDGFVYL